LEALKIIQQVEEESEMQIQKAQDEARKIIASAEERKEQLLEKAREEGKAEAARILQKAREDGQKEIEKMRVKVELEIKSLRQGAQNNRERAINAILRGIVEWQ